MVRLSNHLATLAPVRDAPEPASDPGRRTVDAVRALARASRVLERASGELTLAQYRVLAAVASGAERASRIAERLALGKPTISASVEALCRRGLLARSEVAGDQRAAALRLTPEGEVTLAQAEAAMAAQLVALCRRTDDADQVLDALVWLGSAVEEVMAERHARTTAPAPRTSS